MVLTIKEEDKEIFAAALTAKANEANVILHQSQGLVAAEDGESMTVAQVREFDIKKIRNFISRFAESYWENDFSWCTFRDRKIYEKLFVARAELPQEIVPAAKADAFRDKHRIFQELDKHLKRKS